MKKIKLIVTLLSASLLFAGLTACRNNSSTDDDNFSFLLSLDNGSKSVKVGETATIEPIETSEGSYDYRYTSSDTNVLTVSSAGVITGVGSGKSVITAKAEGIIRTLTVTVYAEDAMTGLASFSSSYTEKGEVLGKLEEYAMDKNLTGISLFENGGYVMYNPRIQKGTETYITGYGFGILGEGSITSPLASETNDNWKYYYHSASSSDQKTINDLDADDSQVSDLASYINSSYWSNKMNATKDGYDWYGQLSKDNRPIPLDSSLNELADSSSSSNFWKIHVRTGADGLTYRTNSTKSIYGTDISSFDERGVQLDDYVYAFKALLTKKFGQYRGAELAADKDYGIVGAADYFNATGDATGVNDTLFAQKVGITSGTDEVGPYITINTLNSLTPFYAMYGLGSSLYRPLCQDFISAIGNGSEVTGMTNYGAYIEGVGASPVDTMLSLGAYTLEYWEEDKTIAFKKNDTWFERSMESTENLHSIAGVKICVYTGATTDNTLVIKEFLNGNIDATGIPTIEYLKLYRNDPRTTTTTGDSVFKLNVNSCTEEEWEALFGVNGSVAQTDVGNYWDVKPWMSNAEFLKGLNFSIDRETFAFNRGVIPSNNYLASSYMIDPENGISYDDTSYHQEAMADYSPSTYGFSFSAAQIYFHQAVSELVQNGQLELGTKESPTNISIDIWWMFESDIEDYGDEISGYIESAFNSDYVSGGKVKLTVNSDAVSVALDVYYKHLMVGKFDLGFGSISGNTLDPLNFLEVLKSNNSSGFTLNWGTDTGVVDGDLIYDDKPWSFDALWAAGNSYAIVDEGVESPAFEIISADLTRLENGGLQVDLSVYEMNTEDQSIVAYLYALCLYGTNTSDYSDYSEIYIFLDGSGELDDGIGSDDSLTNFGTWVDNGNGSYTITFSADAVAWFESNYPAFTALGVDLYVYYSIPGLGIDAPSYFTSLKMNDGFPTYVAP